MLGRAKPLEFVRTILLGHAAVKKVQRKIGKERFFVILVKSISSISIPLRVYELYMMQEASIAGPTTCEYTLNTVRNTRSESTNGIERNIDENDSEPDRTCNTHSDMGAIRNTT